MPLVERNGEGVWAERSRRRIRVDKGQKLNRLATNLVWWKYHFEAKLSYRQIAGIVGKPVSTVVDGIRRAHDFQVAEGLAEPGTFVRRLRPAYANSVWSRKSEAEPERCRECGEILEAEGGAARAHLPIGDDEFCLGCGRVTPSNQAKLNAQLRGDTLARHRSQEAAQANQAAAIRARRFKTPKRERQAESA